MSRQDKMLGCIGSRLTYIENCELPGEDSPKAVFHSPVLGQPNRLFRDGLQDENAAVVANSIVSFVAGISQQNKDDIKNAVLFATLVANKSHPSMSGPRWYSRFMTVMITCGWVPTRRDYAHYRATEQLFTMEQVGLKILANAIAAVAIPGATAALLVGVAQQAVEALQSSDKPLRLFEGQSRNYTGAAFNIASCIESDDGEVVMAMGSVDCTSNVNVKNVLFWDWSSNSVSLSRGEAHMVLNHNVYGAVRNTVLNRLGRNAIDAIEDFEI